MKVTLDQRVVLDDRYAGLKGHRGTVVKIGRVWIDVHPDGWPADANRRFRLDTQRDASRTAVTGRFYTLEQWDDRQRYVQAVDFLRDQGVSIMYDSPWRGREVELAAVLRDAVQQQAQAETPK